MKSDRSALVRGAIGGALAATAVVLFFLFVDLVRGQAMRTPEFLAGVLLGRDEAGGFGLLAGYTIVHYAVFVALGAAVGWFLERVGTAASLLLGLVVGFLLFDAVFYAGLILSGEDILESLGWPAFLAGNLLAGMVLVGYLGRTSPVRPRGWRDALRENHTVREGLVAGLVGAAAVALWYFVIDGALGRLLFTPAALGSALFYGVSEPALVEISAATVLGYTVLHVGAFVATGLAFAVLVRQADQNPPYLMALALLFVTFETMIIGLIAILAAWLLEVIPWWSIVLANLIAAAAMGGYLWRRHPGLADSMARAEGSGVEPPRSGGHGTVRTVT